MRLHLWLPETTPHNVIMFVPGIDEPLLLRNAFFSKLASLGVATYAVYWNAPGDPLPYTPYSFGGNVLHEEVDIDDSPITDPILNDLDRITRLVDYGITRWPNIPLYIHSYSFGAAVVHHWVNAESEKAQQIAGVIFASCYYLATVEVHLFYALLELTAPFFGWDHPNPILETLAFRTADLLVPFSWLEFPRKNRWLTRDEYALDIYDRGRTEIINDKWYRFLRHIIESHNRVGILPRRVFLARGGDDVTFDMFGQSNDYALRTYTSAERLLVRVYPGSRHAIFIDAGRDDFLMDILRFITFDSELPPYLNS